MISGSMFINSAELPFPVIILLGPDTALLFDQQ